MSKSRQIAIFVVAIVAVFVLIETVGKPPSAPGGDAPPSPTAGVATALEYIYPRDRVDGFMATCNADGKHGPGCTCLINKVQEHFTLAQYMNPTADDPVETAMVSWGPECARTR